MSSDLKEKVIVSVVLAFGVAALFIWLKYASFLPPLPRTSPTPSQLGGQVQPTPIDVGQEIYQNNSTNPIQQIPDSNPFQSGNANPYQGPRPYFSPGVYNQQPFPGESGQQMYPGAQLSSPPESMATPRNEFFGAIVRFLLGLK